MRVTHGRLDDLNQLLLFRRELRPRQTEIQFGLPNDAIVGKTPFDLFPKELAEIIAADDDKSLQSPDGLSRDEHRWESQVSGSLIIPSKRKTGTATAEVT